MKILTVVYDLDKGGTQRGAQIFALAYRDLGHDSKVLALYEGGPREHELKKMKIDTQIGLTDEYIATLKDWQPEAVHLHSHALKKEEVYKLKDICINAVFVETNIFSVPSDYSDEILKYSYQMSEWCKFLYLSSGGSDAKSVILSYPIQSDSFRRADDEGIAAFKKQYNIPADAFVIGKIGQSFGGKWSHYLIDAFEDFINTTDKNAVLVLVNPFKKLLDYAEKKNLSKNIIHIERIIGDEELCKCYSAFDVFLHITSQGESFGFVLTESMLCETPIITLNTPWSDNSQAEVIGDGIGGLCANTTNDISDFLKKLYSDKKLSATLGKQGRQRIISNNNVLAIATKSIELFQDKNAAHSTKMNVATLPAIQNLRGWRKQAAIVLLSLKLKNILSHRAANYFLKRIVNFKINY